ncbi:porin [Rheinheimera sp. YQF-2]|jgi:predicted porin|uniref:Porin n=1 Tax=Rheinheimera lutimaris TaxID=2740584 RepID=A0A7Y5ARP0_9GAMM|nr:porin [Rheinheimera lutimaris]NRQ43301.1 porin [Rheinheimera lutimaris]
MKKTTVMLVMAMAGVATVQAEPVKLYGQLNVSAQSGDEGEGRFSELKSNSSRFGLKGDYALEDGLTLVYQLEWGVNVSDSSSSNVTARNQYIGLAGNFGEVRLGRHDTATKMSQGKIDQFNDFEADVGGLWEAEVRANNSISYFTPSYNGFGAQLTYILEDSVDAEDAVSAALFYGDDNLKDSNIFLSVAFDSEVNGYDSVRVNGQTKVAGVKLGAMLQRQEDIITGLEQDGWLLSGAYPLGKTELKAQYQTLEDDKAISLGLDYKAGKDTTLFAWYSSFNLDTPTPDRDYLAVGIKHKF